MKTKHFFYFIVLLALGVAAASCEKDDDSFIDSNTKVPKNATFTSTDKDGKATDTTSVDYSYDAQKRITIIQFSEIDGEGNATPLLKFDYTYNADNLVNKARLVWGVNFQDAVFTYNANKEITKIVYGGQISKTVDVTYSSKGYLLDNATVKLSYDIHQVFNIQTSSSSLAYSYEENMLNGYSNLGAQIGVPTFFLILKTELMYLYLFYPNTGNAGVLKEAQLQGGFLFQFTNEKDKLGFVTKSKFINGITKKTVTVTYTYQK